MRWNWPFPLFIFAAALHGCDNWEASSSLTEQSVQLLDVEVVSVNDRTPDGFWITDENSGCKVWWDQEPTDASVLRWLGQCDGGFAHGPGTLTWSNGMPPNRFPTDISYEGTLKRGRLHGPGEMVRIDRATNLTRTMTSTGEWVDGLRTGQGRDNQVTEFVDFNRKDGLWSYEGAFLAGRRHGYGRRVDSQETVDGAIDRTTEAGQFVEGRFAEGLSLRERNGSGGPVQLTVGKGRFESPIWPAEGLLIELRPEGEEMYISLEKIPPINSSPRTSSVVFPDGDVFVGETTPFHELGPGWCALESVGYFGRCKGMVFGYGYHSGSICLVPRNGTTCLRETGQFWE